MADFSTLIAKQVQSGMRVIGNLAVTGTYTATVNGVYDPVADTSTASSVVRNNVLMLIAALDTDEFQGQSRFAITDKIVIAALDLPGIVPTPGDIISTQGINYQVQDKKSVPGNPMWILLVKSS